MNGFQYKHGDRPLEGYTIQRAIGRGGFGEVYFALSDSGREVALKAIQGYEQIELRGVSQCMNLKSPHLVSIFDVRHNEAGRPFVIMEYVAGPSLRELLEQSPSGMGTQKAAFFLREIAKGLTFLHDRGIVHRDLKPGNIFYEDGYVKIGDYGLSKAITASRYSGQTITVGTVHYMAPEIGQGRYDQSIDIYALGCVVYELLTGGVPFFGASHGEILMKHLVSEPDLSGVEEPFASAIRKAMAKAPADRFASVQEMVEAVFGAEHVRNSVSCFSPESLSVVAARVAQKVAVGAPGSSAEAVRLGDGGGSPPPIPQSGSDVWEDFARQMDAIGERVGRFGERFSEGMDRLGSRFGTHGNQAQQIAGPVPEELDSSVVALSADPKNDPLDRRQRRILAVVTGAAMALGAGILGGHSFGSAQGALFLAPLVIFWAALGIHIARVQFGERLRQESGLFPGLVYGGMGCVLALPGLLIFGIIADSSGIDRRLREDTVIGTLAAVGISMLLVNWRGRISPGRPERVGLGQAFMAGLCAWVISLPLGGASVLAGGILAGISMVAQVVSPFDPRAVRRPKKALASGGQGLGNSLRSRLGFGGPTPPPAPPSQGGETVARGIRPKAQTTHTAHTRGAEQVPYAARAAHDPALDAQHAALSTQHSSARPVPPVLRAIALGVFTMLLALGIILLTWAGMARMPEEEFVVTISCGIGAILLSFFALAKALQSTFSGWWKGLIQPLALILCLQSAISSGIYMGNCRLHNDEILVALFFLIPPSILFFVIAAIPARAVEGLFGRAMARRRYQRLAVSPYRRLPAVLLACASFVAPIAGLHRFYVGKIVTGLLYLVTLGFLHIGTIIDLVRLLAGTFTDAQGRRLLIWQHASEAGLYSPNTPPGPPLKRGGEHRDAGYEGGGVSDQRSAISDQRSAISDQRSAISGQRSAISDQRTDGVDPHLRGDNLQPATHDPYAATHDLPSARAPHHPSLITHHSPPRRRSRTSMPLAALAVILIMPAFALGVAVAVDLPGLVAAGLPDGQLSADLYNLFGYEGWPNLLRRIVNAVSVALMVAGAAVLIVARRHAGGRHVSRAVLGSIGLLLALSVLRNAMQRIRWQEIAYLVDTDQAGPAVEQFLDAILPQAMIGSIILLLASIVLLAWPERRLHAEAELLQKEDGV